MSSSAPWPALSFLDALRPMQGWRVETALLASYSADVVTLVAALLALAGRDDDAGDGSPADLADAVEQLRGKAFFVIQEGRLAAMRKRATISVIVDQFVKSVKSNEQFGSWHPKFALVRFLTPQGGAWRLWIGSRNLTVTSNLDFGLTLEGVEGAREGVEIGSIREVLGQVAERAGLPRARISRLLSSCDKVRWVVPKGTSILDLRLLSANKSDIASPHFAGADEVVVVSPFLDGDFVSRAAKWGKNQDCPRYLISTENELRRLAHQQSLPLAAFKDNLLVMESPTREDTDPEPVITDHAGPGNDNAPDEELIVRGLHAKLFAVRHRATWHLWVGSANATMRAWGGANHELVALLKGDKIIGAGLHSLLGSCRTVSLASLQEVPPPESDDEEAAIEQARTRISSAFEGHLARDGNYFRLVADSAFPAIPERVRVQVSLMSGPLVDWSAQLPSVVLGEFDLADQTGLVRWKLSLGKIECQWLQALEVRPPLSPERDHAAIAARMTPAQFVAWIRSLLSGDPESTAGLGSWKNQSSSVSSTPLARITLEEVLGSRARQGGRMVELDARIGTYLRQVMQRHATEPEVLAQLEALSNLWKLVRTELMR